MKKKNYVKIKKRVVRGENAKNQRKKKVNNVKTDQRTKGD